MAETITFSATENSETITVTLNEQARGPAGESGASSWDDLTGKPSTFPPSAHTHEVSEIVNVGNAKLIGRHTSGAGTAQEIGIDGGLELHGANLRRAAITGPVTVAAGGSTSAIANGALSIAMTSGLQTILNGSTGGNFASDSGKLVKFGESGSITGSTSDSDFAAGLFTGSAEGGRTIDATASGEDGVAIYGVSTNGTAAVFQAGGAGAATHGVLARSVNGAGISAYSAAGTYHAEFGQGPGSDRSAIERIRGWFVWFYSTFTGRLKTADITANREWTLGDWSGDIAGVTATQTLTNKTLDAPTITGAASFTSTTRPTSSGTGTPGATDLITRGDGDARFARAWGAALATGVNSDTNTTTYKTVTELSFDLLVGTYHIDCILLHNGNASYATSGVKDRLNFTGTATGTGTLYRVLDNATTAQSVPNGLTSRNIMAESAPSNRSQVTWRNGILAVTAEGQLQVQIAQNTAVAAANTTLDVGSFISITKLS